MEHTATLHLTNKGTDEVANRTFKLGIKLRSILLLLHKPQTVEFALHKSVFPEEEVIGVIDTLVQEGFVEVEAGKPAAAPVAAEKPAVPAAPVHAVSGFAQMAASQSAAPAAPVAPKPAPAIGEFELDEEIILSEAKFLLIDFSVDCFGMQSEKLTEDIRACKTVSALRALVKELLAMVHKLKPAQLDAFRDTVKKINETA